MNFVTLVGANAVAARLDGAAGRLPQQMDGVMTRLGIDLAARVADNLGGAVLERRSGRLAAAQKMVVAGGGGAASVAVGFDPDDVPYGAIQEFGGTTRAHLIAAKEAFALRFSLGGALVFARRVQHPGSVIPAHSFLGAALAATGADAIDAADAAVMDGLKA